MDLGAFQIVPRQPLHEKILSGWRYEGIYSFYDLSEPLEEDSDSGYFVCIDTGGQVIGHVSYGPDGQIGTKEGYVYSSEYLDIGLGMRPDLCGRGFGVIFVRRCLDFARERYGVSKFRLSVAAFNKRAVKVYERVGFSVEGSVTSQLFGSEFYIMTFSVSDSK